MATVQKNGRVTLPKAVRDHLCVKPGDEVRFDLSVAGRVTLAKPLVQPKHGRFGALRGCAKPGMTTDQVMALMRGI